MALKRLLLLSGGMDSIALAWAIRPELSLTIDYGQLAALGEIRSGKAVCAELGLDHRVLRIDCSSIGSGDMAGTPPSEIARRGLAINAEAAWADDPVGVIAVVASLRAIKDALARREVCVYAEPTTSAEDRLGACPTHAGLKRSSKGPDDKSKLQWAVLRGEVANRFTRFVHVVSDLDVTNGFQK